MNLFLGGTCNSSTWREEIIPLLENKGLSYFNPVVSDWTPEAMAKEDDVKSKEDTVELYVITKEMKGPFSIAEAVDASNKKPDKLIFLSVKDGFDTGMLKSLTSIEKIITGNNACVVTSLQEAVATFEKMDKNIMKKSYDTKEIVSKVKSKLADTSAVSNKKLIWNTLVSSNLQPTEVVNIGRSVLALSFSDKVKEDKIEEALNKIGYTIKVHKPKQTKDLRTKESLVQYEVSKKI